MLFICIRLILTANIWLHFSTKEFQTKEEIVEDLYTYMTHAFDLISNVNAPAIYVSTDNISKTVASEFFPLNRMNGFHIYLGYVMAS